VSADRTTVDLDFTLALSELAKHQPRLPVVMMAAGPDGVEREVDTGLTVRRPVVNSFALEAALKIPDGQTMVLCAGKEAVKTLRSMESHGSLSCQVYHTDYFTNTCRVLVLVTPRVIVNEPEEPVFLNNLPPLPR
jgi:hypothetical protein